MQNKHKVLFLAFVAVLLLVAVSAYGQVHKYFTPGSVWGVTMIKIHPGMDQAYLEYLDTQLKKESDISIKNGFMKSYKILRSLGDDGGWNMLILREYDSFASLEKNEEKADEALRQATGIDDQKGMQGYMDRSKVREVVATKFMREVILK
jgi:multidrug efflux pump subunit AcrB